MLNVIRTADDWSLKCHLAPVCSFKQGGAPIPLRSFVVVYFLNRQSLDFGFFLLLFSSVHLSRFMVQPYDALVSYFSKQSKTTRSSPPVFLLMVVTQTVCNDSINKRSLLLSEKNVPQKFELTDKSAANRSSRGNQLTCRRASSPDPRSTIAATLDTLSCQSAKKIHTPWHRSHFPLEFMNNFARSDSRDVSYYFTTNSADLEPQAF